MAKKPLSIVEAAKSLPRVRAGQRTFQESLPAEQLAELNELLAWLRTMKPHERPAIASTLELLKERFGRAPSESTFRSMLSNAK